MTKKLVPIVIFRVTRSVVLFKFNDWLVFSSINLLAHGPAAWQKKYGIEPTLITQTIL